MPFTILRHLDAVPKSTKQAVLDESTKQGDSPAATVFLAKASGQSLYDTSAFTLQPLIGDPMSIKANLIDYLPGFSENARDLFERFELEKQIEKLDAYNLLSPVTQKRLLPRTRQQLPRHGAARRSDSQPGHR